MIEAGRIGAGQVLCGDSAWLALVWRTGRADAAAFIVVKLPWFARCPWYEPMTDTTYPPGRCWRRVCVRVTPRPLRVGAYTWLLPRQERAGTCLECGGKLTRDPGATERWCVECGRCYESKEVTA